MDGDLVSFFDFCQKDPANKILDEDMIGFMCIPKVLT